MKNSRLHIVCRVGLSLLVLASTTIFTAPVQASQATDASTPSFSDGVWSAKFSIQAIAPMQATTLDVSYLGDMQFNSSGGTLAGDWTMTGFGIYSGDISGSANISSNGKVEGSSSNPLINTQKFVIDMDVVVSGMAVSNSVDMGSGSQLGITIKSATCNQVVADIAAPAVANYQAAGINANVSGSLVAIRTGDLSAADETDYMDQVGDLLEEAEALKQSALSGGGIDFDKLNEFVTKADNLNIGLKKNIDCGFGGKKVFLTAITGIIYDIASFALQNPQLFTTEELSRILFVAASVGALGSGSANAQQAAELKAKFVQELNNRLNDAQTNNNCSEAVQIQIAAGSLGDPNLKQQAQSVVDAVC